MIMAKAKQSPEPESPDQTTQSNEQRSSLARHIQSEPRLLGGSPFAIMNRFANEMERVFEEFGFSPRGIMSNLGRGWGEIGQGMWSPQIEMVEREGQLIVRADLPGLSKDDVKVDITEDVLTIRGERNQEQEEKDKGYYHSERSYGSFYRRLPLPEGVKAEETRANFRDGVLEITIPTEQRQEHRRNIEIK